MIRGLAIGTTLAALVAVTTPFAAAACGVDSDCVVETGAYRIALPERPVVGAVMYYHGWRGSAERVVTNGSLGKTLAAAGIALIAPDGLNGSWSFPGSPRQERDEVRFASEVLADVSARFAIPKDRVVASGFSMGGSMVWTLACEMSADFAGFAPIAGAFWEPLPENCTGQVPDIVHVHGRTDRTVPIAGRPIGQSWHQGDVYESLGPMMRQDFCINRPPFSSADGRLSCTVWSECGGGRIELCLHDGGHSVRTEWILKAFEDIAARQGWLQG